MRADHTLFNGHRVISVVAEERHGGQFVSIQHWRVGVLHSIGDQFNHLVEDVVDCYTDPAGDAAVANFMVYDLDQYTPWLSVSTRDLMPTSLGVSDPDAVAQARQIVAAVIAYQSSNPRQALMPIIE